MRSGRNQGGQQNTSCSNQGVLIGVWAFFFSFFVFPLFSLFFFPSHLCMFHVLLVESIIAWTSTDFCFVFCFVFCCLMNKCTCQVFLCFFFDHVIKCADEIMGPERFFLQSFETPKNQKHKFV